MNKLVLELQTAEKKVKINLQTPCEDTIYKAVDSSFDFMNQGVTIKDSNEPNVLAEALREFDQPKPPSLPEVVVSKEKKTADELTVVEEKGYVDLVAESIKPLAIDMSKAVVVTNTRARTLPLSNGRENTTPVYSTSYEEQRRQNNEKHSGVKEFNGRTFYQTYYTCSNCGHKGKRFLAEDEHIAYCHECNQKMKKQAAVEGSHLERDIFGNFFIAREGIL